MRTLMIASALALLAPSLAVAEGTSQAPFTLRSDGAPRRTARNDAPVTVVVQNNRNTVVTVYVEYENEEVKLGVVSPLSTATLELPRWFVTTRSTVDFVVQPKGGFEQETGPMEVDRGEVVGVIVPKR